MLDQRGLVSDHWAVFQIQAFWQKFYEDDILSFPQRCHNIVCYRMYGLENM
jgi:hypothetical protein